MKKFDNFKKIAITIIICFLLLFLIIFCICTYTIVSVDYTPIVNDKDEINNKSKKSNDNKNNSENIENSVNSKQEDSNSENNTDNNSNINNDNANTKSNSNSSNTYKNDSNTNSNNYPKNSNSNAVEPITPTVTYSCPNGFTLSDTQCISVVDANRVCPTGTTDYSNGNIPHDTYCVNLSEGYTIDSESCPSGYGIISIIGFGTPTIYKCLPLHEKIYICNDGYSLNGNKCIKTINASIN